MEAAAVHLSLAPAPSARAIDHVVLPVRSYAAGCALYRAALAPLGLTLRLDWPDRGRAHFGTADGPSSVWVVERTRTLASELAFTAPDRRAVDEFFAAALREGALPVREPQPYVELTADAYGAAVVDPDGNVLEAISRSSL